MPDKPGDTFRDKKGREYVLGPDPKGGHLRPFSKKGGGGCGTIIVLAISVTALLVAGSGAIISWLTA